MEEPVAVNVDGIASAESVPCCGAGVGVENEGYDLLGSTSIDDIDSIHVFTALQYRAVAPNFEDHACLLFPEEAATVSSISKELHSAKLPSESTVSDYDSECTSRKSLSSGGLKSVNLESWEGELYCPLSLFHFSVTKQSKVQVIDSINSFLQFHHKWISYYVITDSYHWICMLFDGVNVNRFDISLFQNETKGEFIVEWRRVQGSSPLFVDLYRLMFDSFTGTLTRDGAPSKSFKKVVSNTSIQMEMCKNYSNLSEVITTTNKEVQVFMNSLTAKGLNEYGALSLWKLVKANLFCLEAIYGLTMGQGYMAVPKPQLLDCVRVNQQLQACLSNMELYRSLYSTSTFEEGRLFLPHLKRLECQLVELLLKL